MKKLILSLVVVSVIGFSCSKSDPAPPGTTSNYMTLTAGSTWNYESIDILPAITTTYTITSTNRDSVIMGKTYHVFTNSNGSANEYYNISGNDYYNFRNLPAALGGSSAEIHYLNDNAMVGASWNQSVPATVSGISFTATLTNTVTEKGISKVVKGVTYNDVIHVTTTIGVSIGGIPLPASALTTDIQSFYARKFGLIQSTNKINLNYAGVTSNTNQQTNLNTADLK
ncbi:MAG: hypothetical protein JWP81_3541 [Ferruginibacter sp.]|nr:hypothetical protein [Ferruginibacter sp.]